jgi:hypothetical protein
MPLRGNTTAFTAVLLALLYSGCATREPLEPLGRADVRLVGKPLIYGSMGVIYWEGLVKNYGDRVAYNVRVGLKSAGGSLNFGGIGSLRPGVQAKYGVRGDRRIDYMEVVWEELDEDENSTCYLYHYTHMGDRVIMEELADCTTY